MLLVTYRHGFRAIEVCALEWPTTTSGGPMNVRRAKNGKPAVHPIRGDELRALRRLQREQEPKSSFVFTSEAAAPWHPTALASS
ncbi:MAG: tyrosine-type recombinase/integrase [Hyphomicrobiales bacterium]|nr:tyrosine-type recombinase/integrase [Hyphomicrobiales bacterium]